MAGNHELGNKIRQIRELKKASLADIASASHLSEKQLEQIENGEIQPALGIISRIAAALGVRVGTFTDNHESRSAVVTRADEVGRVRTSTRISFDPLALPKDDRNMEPSIISINPETGDETELSTHEGEEFLYILEGQMRVEYGNETFELHPGDSIYMDSIIRHRIASADGKPVRAISVIYMPI